MDYRNCTAESLVIARMHGLVVVHWARCDVTPSSTLCRPARYEPTKASSPTAWWMPVSFAGTSAIPIPFQKWIRIVFSVRKNY